MTNTASASRDKVSADIKTARAAALDAGRAAAARRRRADSERCRQRVLNVLAKMRRSRTPLSDAEITRRAEVNPQYLQRHRDLKAEAVRAHLAGDRPRVAAAASARKETALEVENRMLLEQNAALRRNLEETRAQLRALRVQELGARARGGLRLPAARDAEMEELRKQRDAAMAASHRVEADLTALRNVNQRLMVDNSRLLEATSSA